MYENGLDAPPREGVWINPDHIVKVQCFENVSQIDFSGSSGLDSIYSPLSPTAIAQLIYEATHNQ